MVMGLRQLRWGGTRGVWERVRNNWGVVLVSGCGVRSWDAGEKRIFARIGVFGCRNWWGSVWGRGDVRMWRWGNGLGCVVMREGELGSVISGVGCPRWG